MTEAGFRAGDERLLPGSLSVIALFSCLALLFILLKSLILSQWSATAAFAPFNAWHQTCAGELRPCLRASSAVIGLGFEYAFRGLAELMFWEPARSPIAAHTPWPLPASEHLVLRQVVPLAAYLAFCFSCLVPILVAAFQWYRTTPTRLLFVLAVFGALFGWHPVVVTLFFDAMGSLVDWPRSYYLFWPNLFPYDFAALAVVMISLLYAGAARRKQWWELAALAAVAQLTIEYLGFVFGLALATAALFEPGLSGSATRREALRRLVIAAVASIVAAAASALAFHVLGHVSTLSGTAQDSSALLSRWLPVNLSIWKVVAANAITLGLLALAGGVVVAGWACLAGSGTMPHPQTRRLAGAALGVVTAYLAVLLAGMVFLAYPAEMARQFMPMALAMAVVGAKGLEAGWQAITGDA